MTLSMFVGNDNIETARKDLVARDKFFNERAVTLDLFFVGRNSFLILSPTNIFHVVVDIDFPHPD